MLVAVTKGKGKGGGEGETWKRDKESDTEEKRECTCVCEGVRGKGERAEGSSDGIFKAVRHTFPRKVVIYRVNLFVTFF